MKAINLLIITAIAIIIVSCSGGDPVVVVDPTPPTVETTLKDNAGTTIGFTFTGGLVRDMNYERVGFVYTDGDVFDLNTVKLGSIVKAEGTAYNVLDSDRNLLGTVDTATGEVRDLARQVVGYGSGNPLWKAGVILLLFPRQ